MSRFALSRHFASALNRAVEDHFNGNLTAFSRHARLSQSSVAYYARGGEDGRHPSAEALERLLAPFPTPARAELARAFCYDLLPASARKLVQVEAPKAPKPPRQPRRPLLPQETEEALDYLAKAALESHEVRMWLEKTAKIMQGK